MKSEMLRIGREEVDNKVVDEVTRTEAGMQKEVEWKENDERKTVSVPIPLGINTAELLHMNVMRIYTKSTTLQRCYVEKVGNAARSK